MAIHDVNQLPSDVDSTAVLVSPGFRTQAAFLASLSRLPNWLETGILQITAMTVKRDRTRVEDLSICSTKKKLHLFGSLPYSKLNCVGECLAKIVWKVRLFPTSPHLRGHRMVQECACTWWGIPSDLSVAARYLNDHVKPWPPEQRNVLCLLCSFLIQIGVRFETLPIVNLQNGTAICYGNVGTPCMLRVGATAK